MTTICHRKLGLELYNWYWDIVYFPLFATCQYWVLLGNWWYFYWLWYSIVTVWTSWCQPCDHV